MQDPSSHPPETTPRSGAGLDVERLIALGRVKAVVPSPCGTWLAVEVARPDEQGSKYRADLWRVVADPADEAAPLRLTRGPAHNHSPRFRPDGGLVFLSNRPTGEGESSDKPTQQVWLLPAGGGEAQPLTDEPLGVTSFALATAGDRLVAMTQMWPDIALEEQRKHGLGVDGMGKGRCVRHAFSPAITTPRMMKR